MRNSIVAGFDQDSPEYIVLHAQLQRSKGKRPSASFSWQRNPDRALKMARRLAYFPKNGTYLAGANLAWYTCSACGAQGCKLWRAYNTFMEHQTLLCATCSSKTEKEGVLIMDEDGRHWNENCGLYTYLIGLRVPAIPTEECNTYWGYTSVPGPAIEWWRKLPTHPSTRTVTLSERVRTFQRIRPWSILLSKHEQIWLEGGETHILGPVKFMCFDHRDHNASEVLSLDASISKGIQRFVLMEELEFLPK